MVWILRLWLAWLLPAEREGLSPPALIHGELLRQASMLAFNDTFLAISLLLVMPRGARTSRQSR